MSDASGRKGPLTDIRLVELGQSSFVSLQVDELRYDLSVLIDEDGVLQRASPEASRADRRMAKTDRPHPREGVRGGQRADPR